MPEPSTAPARRLSILVLLVASAMLTNASPAPADTPVPATFFGVSPVHTADFPLVPLGTVAHPGFAWPAIEAVKDSFDFSIYDTYVTEAMAHGLYDPATNTVDMAMTLGLTPSWATSDTVTCTHGVQSGGTQCGGPPDSLDYWTRFLTALVQHYDGVTAPHIRYYELWNEADDSLWWAPDSSGKYRQILELAKTAYPIVHQDPYSMLLTPSVTGDVGKMVNWMSGYLKQGGASYADGGAFHGYPGHPGMRPFPMPESDAGSGSIITKVTAMRAVFDTCGLLGKPMFQTEGSWGDSNVTAPDTMVAWIARFELLQAGLRSSTNLQLASWFAWANPSFGWGNIETRGGLPNAAGIAYERVYEWVVGASIASPCTMSVDSTWTCTMTRPGGYVGLAVWNAHGPATYTPGVGFTRYHDLAGGTASIPSGGSVPIGMQPVLIEKGVYTNDVPTQAPGRLALLAAPSVTRSGTRILFGVPLEGPANLSVWDVSGRLVRALPVAPRSTWAAWDGRDATGHPARGGVYFVRLDSPRGTGVARVIVVR